MEQVLLLIQSKFEGIAYPPYPTVPPALYVPLDSLQSRIFISSIQTEVDKKYICNFFLFPALGTFTNCSGYLLHRNYGQYAFFNSTSETGSFNEKKTNNVSEKSLATKYVFFSYV